jgi:hypothetical protein
MSKKEPVAAKGGPTKVKAGGKSKAKTASDGARGKTGAAAKAEKPGLPRVTPAPVLVVARTGGRGGAVRGPGAAEAEGVARLPTATDEMRRRGLRYLLTVKSNAAPEAIAAKLGAGTGLPWKVERLFRGARVGELDRFLIATLRAGVAPRDLEINAFDLGDQLVAAAPADVARAEPDLPQNVYEPGHDPVSPLRFRGARRGGDGDKKKPPKDVEWHLKLTNVPQAWQTPPMPGGAALGAGVRVGHPDTGYTRHATFPDPTLDVARDYDFVKDDRDALDPMDYRGNKGHGTKTASVIVGRGVPRDGGNVRGVAPAATLVPIRAIKSVVVLWNGDVARAIKHAVDQGCHVISMSLGGLGTGAIEAAVNLAVDRDLIVLAAAGNQVSFVVSPANYERCIAVAARNVNKAPWSASAHGRAVAITAPGEDVWVAKLNPDGQPQNEAVDGSGTSFAVATTAGAAALWLAHHGRDNLLARYAGKRKLQDVFRDLIRRTAHRVANWDTKNYGPGILDVAALLAAPLPPADVIRGSAARRGSVPRRQPAAAAAPAGVRTAVGRLAALLDDAPPDRVAAALRSLVGRPRGGGGGDGAGLDRYATEMLHLLGTDPTALELFRAAIKRSAGPHRGRTRSAATASAGTGVVVAILADRASDTLARALLR